MYIYIYIYNILTGIKFTNISSKQEQILFNRWLKDREQAAENLQNSYAKFHILFKNIPRKIATKCFSTLVFSLAHENFIRGRSIKKYVYRLQSCSISYSPANRDTNGNKANSKQRFNRLLNLPQQRYPKSVFKSFLGQQNNVTTTFSRALFQCYVADVEEV